MTSTFFGLMETEDEEEKVEVEVAVAAAAAKENSPHSRMLLQLLMGSKIMKMKLMDTSKVKGGITH